MHAHNFDLFCVACCSCAGTTCWFKKYTLPYQLGHYDLDCTGEWLPVRVCVL